MTDDLEKSFVNNCYIICKPEDHPLFKFDHEGRAIVRLDGYAIVPLDEFNSHIGAIRAMADEVEAKK